MPLDPDLVALLACPQCHGPLASTPEPEGFGCSACHLFFAVDDGIPNFLIEDARPWPLEPSARSGG